MKVLEHQRKSKELQEGQSKCGLTRYRLSDRDLPDLRTASMLVSVEVALPLLPFEHGWV